MDSRILCPKCKFTSVAIRSDYSKAITWLKCRRCFWESDAQELTDSSVSDLNLVEERAMGVSKKPSALDLARELAQLEGEDDRLGCNFIVGGPAVKIAQDLINKRIVEISDLLVKLEERKTDG